MGDRMDQTCVEGCAVFYLFKLMPLTFMTSFLPIRINMTLTI